MDHIAAVPAIRGGLIALLAAVLFGISTPIVQRFGVAAPGPRPPMRRSLQARRLTAR